MARSFINRINSYYDSLSKSDQAISDYLINNIDCIPTQSIQGFAKNSGVSTATISRYAKKIGYQSFQELKLAINSASATLAADESSGEFFSELAKTDSLQEIMLKNFNSNISSLKSTLNLITEDDLEQAMNLLLKAQSVSFFGLGGSNAVAQLAYHKFLRMPINALYNQDYHYQQMLASKLTSNDCAIIISHTGRNKDTLRILEILNSRKVPVIAITSFASSQLAKSANVALISISEEISFRPEAVASIVSQISILDAIFMMYAMRSKNNPDHTLQDIRGVIKNTRLD